MLTSMLPGGLAAMAGQAAVGPVAGDSAQHVTPDIVLAQLDIIAAASGGAMHAVSSGAVDPFVFRLSIFVLAIFVGYYVVWSVTPALHTPLMSVTNAISSVIVVGALLAVGVPLVANDAGPVWARALGFVALIFASVNIFGGFLVTQRMLGMYQKKKK
jgi:NAD(P) transhydrogenase subunit alpha